MYEKLQQQFFEIGDRIVRYLPELLAGIALVAAGWLLGWLAKRIVMQLAKMLRLDRFMAGSRWGKDLSRGDVRYGFYRFMGNLAFFIVFLIFLQDALVMWKLKVISDLMARGIYFLPRVIIGLIIIGIGWLIASWTAGVVKRSLTREHVLRASLVSQFLKAALLFLFFGVAFAELDVARDVVVIGFATIFGTLGLLTVVIVAVGGKEFVKDLHDPEKEK
jgi:hypothetical protein